MTDEEVIKRRLIIDGDGTGDERRLNTLHKSLHKLCSGAASADDLNEAHNRILAQLSQCEFAVRKSRKVANMNTIELENYQNLSRKITMDIDEEKMKIEKTKIELVEAQRIRKNKMEYDVLGKVISKQPDRKKTEEELTALQNELASLHAAKTDVMRRLSSRKRQFHGLVLMLHQLQATVAEADAPPPQQEEDSVTEEDEQVMELDVSTDEVVIVV